MGTKKSRVEILATAYPDVFQAGYDAAVVAQAEELAKLRAENEALRNDTTTLVFHLKLRMQELYVLFEHALITPGYPSDPLAREEVAQMREHIRAALAQQVQP
jgi:hypothetical protein